MRSPHRDATPEPWAVGTVESVDDLAAELRRVRRRAARDRGGLPLSYRELAARAGWAYGSFSGYFRGGVCRRPTGSTTAAGGSSSPTSGPRSRTPATAST